MANLITTSEIATLLGVDYSLINSNLYTWAKSQFFIITGLKESETTKVYRRLLPNATTIVQLPDKNISEITAIKQDNVELDYENYVNYTLNPDTGNIVFSGGVFGFIEITYKISAYTILDIHNYLLTLLVCKALMIFNPQVINNLQSVNIGRFSKSITKTNPIEDLDEEIERIKIIILEEGSGFSFGNIG